MNTKYLLLENLECTVIDYNQSFETPARPWAWPGGKHPWGVFFVDLIVRRLDVVRSRVFHICPVDYRPIILKEVENAFA